MSKADPQLFIRRVNLFINIHPRVYLIPKFGILHEEKLFDIYHIYTLGILCFDITIRYITYRFPDKPKKKKKMKI